MTNVRGLGDLGIFSSHHVYFNIICQICYGEVTLVLPLWLECEWEQGCYKVSSLKSLHTRKKVTQRKYANDSPANIFYTDQARNSLSKWSFGLFCGTKENNGHMEI